ncbi:MAG: lytic transglycosylase domain-containing protein [Ruminococcaceae bacterium]|nr:lytic transglycosylase domain-containing protein [Oscillospiraceae bacterium]
MKFYYMTSNKKNFTNQRKNDIINENKITQRNVNLFPLNDMQKANIKSAKKAMDNGVISQKQYEDNLKLNGINRTEKENSSTFKLPNEKLELERLKKITGEYNLSKISPDKLEDSIRLKKKTSDDYYKIFSNISEEQKRLDEALGAKTDFSISNFENNYDMFNQEEKEMITHKMQLLLNNNGYTNNKGFRLKTDGIFGNNTREAYEKYKKDNEKDYIEAIENKKIFTNSIETSPVRYEGKLRTAQEDLPKKYISYSNMPKTIKQSPANQAVETYYSYEEFDHPDDVKKKADNPKIVEKANKVIQDHATYIKNAAQKFGVNPGILGTCIYAEQVLNVNIMDTLTDVYAGNRGIDTSIGVSQVKLSTAKDMEDLGYMPKIESSKDGSLSSFIGLDENIQRVEALSNPETNIMYAAAYLKYFQDIWEKAFPEIDGRTAILATLYNLGHKITSPNSNPKPNDFGRFARNNYFHVNRLLGL